MGIQVDNHKNASSVGTKGSIYFGVGSDSSSSVHEVTLNYDSGHWCSCRGMIAKQKKFSSVKDPRQSVKVEQTSRHFCKHITAVRSADSSIRIEARRRRNETFGIMESPIDPETGVSSEAPVEQPTMGRRAAISAQKSKSAADRLAEVESQAAALRAQVEIEDTLAALKAKHGEAAVKAALTEAA